MSLVVFQHHPRETPAALGAALRDLGHRLRVIRLDLGQSVPADLDDVNGVLSLGGPMNCDEKIQHPWISQEMDYLKRAHAAGKPMVGICLGAQLIAVALGGQVAAMPQPEAGFQEVKLSFQGSTDAIYQGIAWNTMQFHLHGQEVVQPPPESTVLAGSQLCKIQACKVGLTTYAFQYHFEWSQAELAAAAEVPLVGKAGLQSTDVMRAVEQHYQAYRRLGDRLCQSLGMMLFLADTR